MSELRRDPLSGRWFVLAAERAKRPEAFYRARRRPAEDRECPFCPGNEEHTTPEVLRYSNPDGSWAVRVVPNKFADMADPEGIDGPRGDPLHRHKPSAGCAEVLIESPDHEASFDTHSPEQARLAMLATQERCRALAAKPGVAVVMAFRNYLPESGASLLHPHGQILASSHLPPVLEAEAGCFEAYRAEHAECLACALLRAEADGPRLVGANAGFMTIAPYASRSAFELLILPRTHAPDFLDADPAASAAALQDAFGRLKRALGDPPCNMWIHCRPQAFTGDFHWHIHITPRLTVEGAWELGTGLAVNIVPPEQAAEILAMPRDEAKMAVPPA